ncbi:HAT (Half-A-TPR) repeat [Musa troglodytarum]|uniref:HAT (Half-A-TPR) repeat n=1 Tax=Musa troglodytarum TaxID=320322 RepID=A0A9E7K6V1_9LILI|nr:HAT (Half-A-TPR) repeat [Musa troglodytarum]
MPRPTSVKNRNPAPIQITAEQILCEAMERQDPEIHPPKKNHRRHELNDDRLLNRKEFEDPIYRACWNNGAWIKYEVSDAPHLVKPPLDHVQAAIIRAGDCWS